MTNNQRGDIMTNSIFPLKGAQVTIHWTENDHCPDETRMSGMAFHSLLSRIRTDEELNGPGIGYCKVNFSFAFPYSPTVGPFRVDVTKDVASIDIAAMLERVT